jgi:hypothetical protein
MTNDRHQPGPRKHADANRLHPPGRPASLIRRRPARHQRTDPRTAEFGLTAALASDAVLDAAFAWLCRRRQDWPADADIWSFRRNWRDEKQRLQGELLSGRFRFGLLQRVTKADGSEADLWSARDGLVLKALTLVLARVLPVSPLCTHIKGNGGAKAAVRQVRAALARVIASEAKQSRPRYTLPVEIASLRSQ